MNTACPSCHQPIDQDETLQRLADGGTVTRCSNCGVVLSSDDATGTFMAQPKRQPTAISKFKMIRLLGEGGFGAVWLAEDRQLGRRVALKLPNAVGRDATLLHEAQTAAKLRHPNIVSIYEVGEENDQVFIASEFIDGEDLRSEMARGRPPIDRAVRLIATLARAVHHAHEHQVVHRDIKPANVIINSEGEPFVTDFGIAKQLSVDETISADGAVVGTVSYMSPEQARGDTRETDHRSDIYALGVMLFEMLTEFRPFRGNARAVIDQKINEDAPSPRKLVPSLPKDLETICLKCLEREPSNRYQSAEEVASELDNFSSGIPIKARPVSRTEKAWRWCKRKPLVATLLLGFLITLVAGMSGVTHFWLKARDNAVQAQESLYVARMNLAAKLWESGDIEGVRRTLSTYGEDSDAGQLRDFEWHYFSQLTEPFVQIVNHGESVMDIALSRDGNSFASSGNDRTIRVWDAKTGKLSRTLQPTSGRIESIEYSPVDDRLVSAHTDGIIRLWNPSQHDHTTREFPHGVGLSKARFSPDGRFLLSVGKNGAVKLWSVKTAEEVAQIPKLQHSVSAVCFSPNGKTIALAGRDGVIAIWDTQANDYVQHLGTNTQVLCISFVAGGETLVAGTYGSSLQYWSLESGKRVHTLRLGGGAVGDIEYLTDAKLIAVVTTSHDLRLIDDNYKEVRRLATHSLTHGMLSQSRNGKELVVGSGDGSVKLLDVESLRRKDVFWHDTHVRDLEFLSDGKRLAGCAGDGSVQVWDLDSNQTTQLVAPNGREMLAISVQSDGHLLAASGMNRHLSLVDVRDGKLVDSISLPHAGFSALAFSPDGELLAAGSLSGTILVYAMNDRAEPKFEITESNVRVNDLKFTPDGRQLVAAFSDGRVVFVSSTDGSLEGKSVDLKSTPLAIAFYHDGSQLTVGTQIGEIHFVDLATRKTTRVLKAHTSRINSLVVLPDDTRIVSGGRDKQLRVWDIDSGELVTSLSGHGRQVFTISASANGSKVVSAGLAGDIRIWRTDR